jgi:hypothetical protein
MIALTGVGFGGCAPWAAAAGSAPPAASLGGTTGIVIVPTAEVLPDRSVRFGAVFVDKDWTYEGRGVTDHEIYFVSFGFLPRLEVTIRATVQPGIPLLEGEEAPAVDRMGSARVKLLVERTLRPAIALGVDDPRGTKFFHALYFVSTKSLAIGRARCRITAGYGSDVLTARNYVLNGFFGGAELFPTPWLTIAVDYDTEKLNTSVRLRLVGRFGLHAALLHLDTPSGGLDWTLPL